MSKLIKANLDRMVEAVVANSTKYDFMPTTICIKEEHIRTALEQFVVEEDVELTPEKARQLTVSEAEGLMQMYNKMLREKHEAVNEAEEVKMKLRKITDFLHSILVPTPTKGGSNG